MRTVTIPCDCDDEEHEVEYEGEGGGLYTPSVGDALPCGRLIDENDMDEVFERLKSRFDDEGD